MVPSGAELTGPAKSNPILIKGVPMNQQPPQAGSEEVTLLGAPRLVCRTSRKTLFWGFLLASLTCVLGIVLLIFVLRRLTEDWSRDRFGSVVFLTVGVLLLWGGRAQWRKANRLRHVQVVVHAGGLSSRDGSTCLTCRWDQIGGLDPRFEHVFWDQAATD